MADATPHPDAFAGALAGAFPARPAASPDAGRPWLADSSGGAVLCIDDAYELDRRVNERFLQHTRRPTAGGSA